MSIDIRRSRSNESLDAVLLRLATRQYGVFSRDQVLALGFSPSQIDRRITTHRWESVLPRVYRVSGAPLSGRQAAIGACLWAGDGAVVSHRAAGILWGLEGVNGKRVELWVPAGRKLRTAKLMVHRTHDLPRLDRTHLGCIPITTPARTLIDLAGVIGDEPLEAAVESALRQGRVSERLLRMRLDALGGSGRAGTSALRRILDRRGERAAALEHRLEVKVWRLLVRSGLPKPIRQHPVEVDGRRYRLDFAWPSFRVAVEADGFATHGGRSAFHGDRRRAAGLVSEGWRIVPVTWQDATARSNEWLHEVGRTLALAA
jgi:very-short-patch-repair endonuclease